MRVVSRRNERVGSIAMAGEGCIKRVTSSSWGRKREGEGTSTCRDGGEDENKRRKFPKVSR